MSSVLTRVGWIVVLGGTVATGVGVACRSKSGNKDAASSSSGGSSGPSSSSSVASAGSGPGGSGEGGPVWSPTNAQPIHFHWQLSDTFTTADLLASQQGTVVYDIDGQNATAADVAAIHAAGAKAVCYVDVGTLEQGRPDYAQFPSAVIGPAVEGWPGESWLLVTAANQSTLLPLMKARLLSWCQAKGFDAIEPDNLDAFSNLTGQVTEADNLTYDLAIARMAHALSLSIGLKNLLPDVHASYVPSLLANFDWALVEQCYEYAECSVYSQAGSFLPLGKAVFEVEYNQAPTCTDADTLHMNAQRRDLNLAAPTDGAYVYTPCVPDAQASW